MNGSNSMPENELKELKHEAVPGYKTAFYITFICGVIYLALIFTFSYE